jgi:hypothetical protein
MVLFYVTVALFHATIVLFDVTIVQHQCVGKRALTQ